MRNERPRQRPRPVRAALARNDIVVAAARPPQAAGLLGHWDLDIGHSAGTRSVEFEMRSERRTATTTATATARFFVSLKASSE